MQSSRLLRSTVIEIAYTVLQIRDLCSCLAHWFRNSLTEQSGQGCSLIKRKKIARDNPFSKALFVQICNLKVCDALLAYTTLADPRHMIKTETRFSLFVRLWCVDSSCDGRRLSSPKYWRGIVDLFRPRAVLCTLYNLTRAASQAVWFQNSLFNCNSCYSIGFVGSV